MVGVEMEVDESADELVEGVVALAAIAVGLDRFSEFRDQPDGLFPSRAVPVRPVHARKSAEPLAENAPGASRRPPAEAVPGSGKTHGRAEALQNIVLVQAEVELPGREELVELPALAEADAPVFKRLDFYQRRA